MQQMLLIACQRLVTTFVINRISLAPKNRFVQFDASRTALHDRLGGWHVHCAAVCHYLLLLVYHPQSEQLGQAINATRKPTRRQKLQHSTEQPVNIKVIRCDAIQRSISGRRWCSEPLAALCDWLSPSSSPSSFAGHRTQLLWCGTNWTGIRSRLHFRPGCGTCSLFSLWPTLASIRLCTQLTCSRTCFELFLRGYEWCLSDALREKAHKSEPTTMAVCARLTFESQTHYKDKLNKQIDEFLSSFTFHANSREQWNCASSVCVLAHHWYTVSLSFIRVKIKH